MPLTTTTGANSIREAYEGGFESAVFRNDSFLGLFEKRSSMGDTNHRWKANSAANDSVEIFSEGGAQPDAGHQAISNCAVAWTYFRGTLQISGHARDALKSRWLDQIDLEMTGLVADLRDLMTTSFMGSTYGLELAVDYGSAYAGVTRNSAAGWFEATETAHSAAMSTDGLIDLQEAIRDNDKGQRGPAAWLMALNQESNLYRLQGPHVVHNSNPADKAPGLTRQSFNGEPVYALPDWSDTVVMRIDRNPGHIVLVEQRPFTVHDQGRSGDSDVYAVTWAGALIDHMPKFDGKLTGVTA